MIDKTRNNRAWLLILPMTVLVAFSAIVPLMTVVNYSVQDILGPNTKVYVGFEWFRKVLRDPDLHAAFLRQLLFSAAVLLGLAVWKQALEQVATAVGIYYPPSALFAVALGFILVLLLHFSLVISRLADQNKILAQKLGALSQRVDELEARAAVESEPVEPRRAGLSR